MNFIKTKTRSKEAPASLPPESRAQWEMAFGNMSAKAKSGKQTPAKKLTEAIRELVEFKYKAVTAQVSTMGVYNESLGRRVHGGATLGYEDIPCILPCWFNGVLVGVCVAIEVKAGDDRMSEKQQKRKGRVESVGGLYIEARSTLQVEQEIDAFLARITGGQRV